MEIKTAIEIIKNYYGTHSAAARALGKSPRRYRELRNGGMIESAKTQILNTAKLISSLPKQQVTAKAVNE